MTNDDMLEYHRGHFEDDINTFHLAVMGERYVIRLIKESDVEEQLQFFTCFLEDFVSGMAAVPFEIDLRKESYNGEGNRDEYILHPSNVELKHTNWKDYPYIDLNDPTVYENYENHIYAEDELDAFEGALKLEKINITKVRPMKVVIERCNYIIPRITIEDYLDAVEVGISIHTVVKTLDVTHWGKRDWNDIHTIALTHICHQLQITKLRLVFKDPVYYRRHGTAFFNLLEKCQNPNINPFLSKLRKIEIEFNGTVPPIWHLFKYSKIRKITWILFMKRATKERILDYADEALNHMYSIDHGVWIHENYDLRELKFRVPWSNHPIDYDPRDGPFNVTEVGNSILEVLERNQRGFKKCVDAIVIILGLRKMKKFKMYRDVLGLIAFRVWDTRSTAVWVL